MEVVEATWTRVIKLWWSFFWRVSLVSLVLGFLVGALLGVVLFAIGREDLVELAGGLVGYLVGIPVAIVVFKALLEMRWSDFQLKLVRETPEPQNHSIAEPERHHE